MSRGRPLDRSSALRRRRLLAAALAPIAMASAFAGASTGAPPDAPASDRRVPAVGDRPRAPSIEAPLIAQALPNNCETAALQVLLATLGVDADQLELQRDVPRSGPLDPIGAPPEQVWGDPALGYVGRADGTGPAGGFGVYQGPIIQLAASRGVELEDLSGTSREVIYERLRRGRAVMAWVGLDDGPYGTWTSPDGETVRVNFNEHTVVLTGVNRDGSVNLVNVLEGTREVWHRELFEQRFERLDRRAVAAPA
jgi:uncharacterized protein YvpB